MSLSSFDPFGDPFRHFDRLTNQLLSGTRTPIAMPMDVWKSGDGFHVDLDLPGVDPSSVDITCERNVLTVTAQRDAEYQPNDQVLLAERSQGSFTRQLQLGDAVDPENIRATYANGVLCLVIPSAPEAQPRRIQVQHQQGQQTLQVEGEATQARPAGDQSQGQPQQGQSGESTPAG